MGGRSEDDEGGTSGDRLRDVERPRHAQAKRAVPDQVERDAAAHAQARRAAERFVDVRVFEAVRPPFAADAVERVCPRPLPDFLPPLSCLFTVAYARFFASPEDVPLLL
jgi:hypothetical protein